MNNGGLTLPLAGLISHHFSDTPVPPAGLSLPADTLRCVSNNGLCHQTLCPRPLFALGTCSYGRTTCCKGRW
uniref:Beta-defensin-like domain-containing protein n=1 Tax=Chelydra serpentina TaxID=8475 RepID=A0A8C3XUP4_CHESE